MRVDVSLEGKALEIVLEEQARLVKKKTPRGKQKVINMLLTELYERRIYDSIAGSTTPLSNSQWKKFLKS